MRYQFLALGVFFLLLGAAQFPRRNGELAVGIFIVVGGAQMVIVGMRMALIT